MPTMTIAPVPERSGPCHDHAALLQRVGNDLECLRELLLLFEQDVETRLCELESGLAGGSPAAVAAAAHSIRGMALVFSGGYVAAVAGAIEETARAGETTGIAGLLARLRPEVHALTAELEACLAPGPGGTR